MELTKRENQIADLVAHEMAEKEIAEKLFISTETVHTHTRNIRKKLGCRNNVGVAIRYLLSLENPKAFVPGMLFLMLQCHMILSDVDFELRAPRRVKVSRVKKVKSKKDDYV